MSSDQSKILIVNDEPAMCALLRDALKSHGLSPLAIADSSYAKRIMDEGGLDVMVIDVRDGVVTGVDLLAYARIAMPSCRVIIVSGYSDTQGLADLLRLGAFDYFTKPYDLDEVVSAIVKAVRDEPGASNLSARAARAMQDAIPMRQMSLESIRALVHAVEAKDPHTRRHSEQVAHYTVCLARFLNLSPEVVETLRIAALLHDVGKIGIPDHILVKPGGLTSDEFDHIRRHPVLGSDILKDMSMFADEARLVRYHHERWNGKGYPEGLAAEEIPFGARLINVADSMDAMLMQRSYKQAYPVEKMIDELKRCAAVQFDPRLAAAAVEWCYMHSDQIITAEQSADVTAV